MFFYQCHRKIETKSSRLGSNNHYWSTSQATSMILLRNDLRISALHVHGCGAKSLLSSLALPLFRILRDSVCRSKGAPARGCGMQEVLRPASSGSSQCLCWNSGAPLQDRRWSGSTCSCPRVAIILRQHTSNPVSNTIQQSCRWVWQKVNHDGSSHELKSFIRLAMTCRM